MRASDFFKNSIYDNNYQGYSLDLINTEWYAEQFNCNIGRESDYSKEKRQDGIKKFLFELHDLFGTKNLEELSINQFNFDEEFEANKEQKVFDLNGISFENIRIYTGNIVGSIIYKGQIFNINCRFGNDFLQYMVANASGFLELENFGTIDKNLGLGEWILIYYWKLQLKKTFALGIYKTYKNKNENLSTVRGKIDLNSILKKGYFDGRTVCDFKEHSYNNELNAVVSMALKKVFKSKYQSIVSDIYNIKSAFDSINTPKVNLNQISNYKILNPYYKKYNFVFDLSIKILKDEFANAGEINSEFSALLFDISLLFEHHIRNLLKQKFKLFPKNKQEFTVPNGIFENNIFPDVVLDFGNNEIGIYDVKYKNFIFNGYNSGVERNDRFQIISYAAIHLIKYKVVECGIIYPLREVDLGQKVNVINQTLKVGSENIPFVVKFYQVSRNINDQNRADKNFLAEMGKPIPIIPYSESIASF